MTVFTVALLLKPGAINSAHAMSEAVSLPPSWLVIQFQSAVMRVSFLGPPTPGANCFRPSSLGAKPDTEILTQVTYL